MSMFPSISIAGTGLEVDQTWIDTTSAPAKPVAFVAEAAPVGSDNVGDGVEAKAVALGSAQGILTYQPDSPLANAKGYVTYPDVNIGNEMTSLVEAQVSYEVNAKVMQNSSDAYNAVLQIKA